MEAQIFKTLSAIREILFRALSAMSEILLFFPHRSNKCPLKESDMFSFAYLTDQPRHNETSLFLWFLGKGPDIRQWWIHKVKCYQPWSHPNSSNTLCEAEFATSLSFPKMPLIYPTHKAKPQLWLYQSTTKTKKNLAFNWQWIKYRFIDQGLSTLSPAYILSLNFLFSSSTFVSLVGYILYTFLNTVHAFLSPPSSCYSLSLEVSACCLFFRSPIHFQGPSQMPYSL